MRFHLSSEQQALADATSGLLAHCSTAHRASAINGELPGDDACWRKASDQLGLPGVAVADEHDGAGGTLLDAAVVLEVAGRFVSTLPLLSSIGAGRILSNLAHPDLLGDLLAEVASGAVVPSWTGLHGAQGIEVLQPDGHDRELLDGRATHVIGSRSTEQLLVLATGRDGETRLYRVSLHGEGVTVATERAVDPTRGLLSVTLDRAPAVELSGGPVEAASLARTRAEIDLLVAAEQVGVAQGALDMAVDYAKTRHQFGRPIGSFQSIKHMLADAHVDLATARDTARFGAWTLGHDPDDAEHLADLTRVSVTPRVTRVASVNLQVHGGIGYTWEHDAHLYYKRSVSDAHLFGEVDAHLDAIAEAIGLSDSLP